MTKTLWRKLCKKVTILKNQHTKDYYSSNNAKKAKTTRTKHVSEISHRHYAKRKQLDHL